MIGLGVVAPLSKVQIESFASAWRRGLGYRDDQAVSMVRVIEFALPQVFEDFEYEIVDDHELSGAEATTSLSHRHMRISNTTYTQARLVGGRASFTLAHEVGHLLLHCGQSVELARGQAMPAYRNPEWQADQFASGFLVPAAEAAKTPLPGVLATRFGITPAAARVRLKRLGLIAGDEWAGGAM